MMMMEQTSGSNQNTQAIVSNQTTTGVTTAISTSTTANNPLQDLTINQSKDAQTLINALKEMDIEEYEPQVINQLMEFSYRYVISLIEDARAFSQHAGKKTIDSDDIKLAIKSKVDSTSTAQPSRELLIEISKAKNKNPLPPIKYHSGIRLPADRFCLHSQNYAMKAQAELDLAAALQRQQQQKYAASTSNKIVETSNQSSSNMVQQMTPSALLASLPAKRRRDDDEEDYDA